MAGPYTPGNVELLTTNFNREVHNILKANIIMKEAVLTQTTSAGVDRFYKESIRELDVNSQTPRDAEFFSDQVVFDTLDIRPQKHGAESRIAWEDSIEPGPSLVERTTIRLANRVQRSVNSTIWNAISENQSAALINTLATSAAWDNATRANRLPHEDIAEGIGIVQGSANNSFLQAYTASELYLSPKDYCFVRTNDYVMSSFDSSTPQLMETGMMGKLLGLNVIVNPIVTADFALVADSKKAVTWAGLQNFQTSVNYTPGKFYTFTAFDYGNAALVNPRAVCLLTNTQA